MRPKSFAKKQTDHADVVRNAMETYVYLHTTQHLQQMTCIVVRKLLKRIVTEATNDMHLETISTCGKVGHAQPTCVRTMSHIQLRAYVLRMYVPALAHMQYANVHLRPTHVNATVQIATMHMGTIVLSHPRKCLVTCGYADRKTS